MSLDGRVAAITGGAGHLGSTAAETLLEQGARVVLIDRDEEGLVAAQRRLSDAHPGMVRTVAADLSDQGQCVVGLTDTLKELGRLDILINNAAFVGTTGLTGWVVPFEEQSLETFDACLRVNLSAAFELTQACHPWLHESGAASVVNISSIYGMVGPDMGLYTGTPMGNPAAYAASKGGLLQLTRWLSTTLAPRIRVNAITPGGIARGQLEVFRDRYEAKTPLGRMATEDDFRGAIAYLSSDMSRYVTGQNLVVDGGFTAW